MSDDRDPILDAYLGEVLGGQTPPDLSARILQAWAAAGHDPARLDARWLAALQGAPMPPPIASERSWLEPVAPPVTVPPITVPPATTPLAPPAYLNGHSSPLAEPPLVNQALGEQSLVEQGVPLVKRAARRDATGRASRRDGSFWISTALAGGVLAIGSFAAYLGLKDQFGQGSVAVAPANTNNNANNNEREPKKANNAPQVAAHNNAKSSTNNVPPRNTNNIAVTPPVFSTENPAKFVVAEPPSAWKDLQASSDQEIVTFVNDTLHASWQANKVKPSAPATDAEWCRRVYLRLIGRIPSVEELSSFTADKSADKRTALVDRLLFDKQYAAEFASFWSTQWSNTLIGRSGMLEKDGDVSAAGLQKYLQEAVAANKPYNKLVYELIAATGSNTPGSPDFNGATNFLLASQNDKSTLATARTTRVFLGQQLQCAQCHNHPFNNTTQHQFWAMNSFFRQMKVERDRKSGVTKLVSTDFRGETGDAAEADVFYELRNGQMKVAYPQYAGIELPKSGLVSEVDRRQELARLIAGSDDVSRAAVNRLWQHFLGFGFTQPVDDMGTHNQPSQPELLERLAKEFKAHNYDTKSLFRWIALSEPFSLSSKIDASGLVADAPELGTAPLFSRYYTRQMQAEELYDSLVAAAQIAKRGGTTQEKFKARQDWLAQFSQSLKTDEGDEASTFNGTIPQSLMMMNGELMQQAISSEHSALLKRVADSQMKPDEKVEHLFLAAVARKPAKRELEVARQLVATHQGNVNDALADIWWALLNSNEFILDH